jgi:very-short-patch-repair endonuclease
MCNESKGEKIIADYLTKKSIVFEREKRFNGCKNIKKLAFDFYFPSNSVLIEFDGRQHYEIVNFCRSREKAIKSHVRLKENDNIKNKFAEANNFHLLRIKYDQINEIDKILDKYEPISQR